MDAAETAKSAVKTAFTFKNVIIFLLTALLVFAALDYFGWSDWIFKPVTKFKAWNTARKASAAS
jgi:hypothetical protein